MTGPSAARPGYAEPRDAAEVERRSGGDRRARPRQGGVARRVEDRHAIVRGTAAAAVALCGAGAALYAGLAAIGALDPTEAVAASAIALVLALVWVAAFWYRMRTDAARAQRRDRERRGF